MKSLLIIMAAVFTAVMLATASPHVPVPAHSISAPLANYTMVDLSWAVESFPDNATSTTILNGTVQEIIQQLIDINPHYPVPASLFDGSNNISPDDTAGVSPDALPTTGQGVADIGNQDDPASTSSICTDRWIFARWTAIGDGIDYLRGLKPGRPANGPGPGACGRVSCSWGSAIYWCNDDDERKELDSWGRIADGAQTIRDTCWYDAGGASLLTRGQVFDPEGWNVIVRGGDKC
ncbi:hypothetical protein diail_3481 [Diaporthe ilicicola]|nr:hypothetical protein diail_3481 [Diaporthe ilicicola]